METKQTMLDLGCEEKAKQYKIQKYTIHCVKEKGFPEEIERRTVTNRKDVGELARKYLGDLPLESILVIAMNSNLSIIGIRVFEGVPNQCEIHPQKVFQFLLSSGAAAFILAHNHPAGSHRPSEADWNITEKLLAIGKNMDLPLKDHIIVANNETISMRDTTRWK